jgi:tellurite resistance protein
MKQFPNALTAAALALAALAAQAQQVPANPVNPAAAEQQRDARQEKRIQQGVASGQVSAREAYRLERQQGRIDAAEAAANADGRVSPSERAHLNRMQNQANRDIWQQKHDVNSAQTTMAPAAPPTSTAPVDRRESTQDARIRQGIASGQIDAREAERLEREQSRIDAAEAHARADGQISAQERARLNHMQNQANADIWHQKHDKQHAH